MKEEDCVIRHLQKKETIMAICQKILGMSPVRNLYQFYIYVLFLNHFNKYAEPKDFSFGSRQLVFKICKEFGSRLRLLKN